MAELLNAGGPSGNDDAGDGSLIGKLRVAQTVIQGNGFNPSLALVSPEDAQALDLQKGAPGGLFLLAPAPRDNASTPLWAMRVIVCKSVADPIVLDSNTVEFYLGNLVFAADTISKFDTNESRFRLEGPTLLVPRQPDAVYVVEAAS